MRILFLGDIVGKKGREVIRDSLVSLKEKYKPDFTIANGENAAHGKGITYKLYKEIISYGIDCITMGNHAYSKKEIFETIDQMDRLVVPFNHLQKVGEGYRLFMISDKKLCVINLLGQAFMGDYMSSPFEAFQKIKEECKADLYFVDFHSEATAEKRIFAEYFKDDVDIVVGTHTHVQTADEDILYDNVAFISDVGMCGPYYSIIGRDIEESIKCQIEHEKTHYEIADTDAILCGVVIDINDKTLKPSSISRIQIRP